MRLNAFFLVALLAAFACTEKKEKQSIVSIIPKPQILINQDGRFIIDEATSLSFQGVDPTTIGVIKDYLKEITGYQLENGYSEGEKVISLDVQKSDSNFYSLIVSPSQINLTASSTISLLNGFQSLRQLILLNEGQMVPAVEIQDAPNFQWRGLLLDCSRHFMKKEFVKRYIDLLAFYKMNVLHWHLTEDQGWRIQIDKYPLLTEVGAWRKGTDGETYGGFYSKDDIREIVSYAENRGITVVPEIELPGHSQAALAAYPEYSCTGGPFEVETEWGVFKEIYCAGNDSTFKFLEDVLGEVIDLFPSEYIHIGGDEVTKFRWERCEKCQRRMREENLHDEHELQSYFIGRIGAFLHSKGKKMIGWDEILEGGLPNGAIVQSWRGYDGAVEAVKQGHEAILSPTSHAYFDYGLNDIDMEKVYGFNPVPEGLSEKEAALILGGECNMWTERAPQSKVDSKIFPRLLAMSEVLWNKSEKDYSAFKERVRDQYKILSAMGVNYGFETVPVKIATSIIEEELFVELVPYDSDINVFYTIGDETVEYHDLVKIDEVQEWKITFARGGIKFNDTITQLFKPHLALGREPTYFSNYHANYTAGGNSGLTDGKKGSHVFRDGNWQGYWGKDVEIIVDLGESKFFSELSSDYLQYNNAWIFFPEYVSYAISSNGKTFNEVGIVVNKESPREKAQKTQQYLLKLQQPVQARFVKLVAKNMGVCPDWHDAAGSDAWIFIDEFSVNE